MTKLDTSIELLPANKEHRVIFSSGMTTGQPEVSYIEHGTRQQQRQQKAVDWLFNIMHSAPSESKRTVFGIALHYADLLIDS